MGKNKDNQPPKKKKKVGLIILAVILVIIAGLAVFIGINSNTNVKAMNSCVDATLTKLKNEGYAVTPVDVGDYETLKIYGIMKFDVEQYDIEGIGNLSIMRMNMGLMQMATIVITPTDKNLPLMSADYMYILGNRKAYLEFYDVVAEKDDDYNKVLTALSDAKVAYEHLEDLEVSPAWYQDLLTVTSYKAGKPSDDKDLEALLINSLTLYCRYGKQMPELSDAEKTEKIRITVDYTDGLIKNGGISTDVFKDALGEEETKTFFDNIFFGTSAE